MNLRGEFFDYDPVTGLHERYEETSDGKIHIHTYQDVTPYLDAMQRMRNAGIADEMWHEEGATIYAALPPIVVGKMLKDGINPLDPNDLPRLVREVNTTYSAFKLTDKHHEVKEGNNFGK